MCSTVSYHSIYLPQNVPTLKTSKQKIILIQRLIKNVNNTKNITYPHFWYHFIDKRNGKGSLNTFYARSTSLCLYHIHRNGVQSTSYTQINIRAKLVKIAFISAGLKWACDLRVWVPSSWTHYGAHEPKKNGVHVMFIFCWQAIW